MSASVVHYYSWSRVVSIGEGLVRVRSLSVVISWTTGQTRAEPLPSAHRQVKRTDAALVRAEDNPKGHPPSVRGRVPSSQWPLRCALVPSPYGSPVSMWGWIGVSAAVALNVRRVCARAARARKEDACSGVGGVCARLRGPLCSPLTRSPGSSPPQVAARGARGLSVFPVRSHSGLHPCRGSARRRDHRCHRAADAVSKRGP